jgi:hypothetical protein
MLDPPPRVPQHAAIRAGARVNWPRSGPQAKQNIVLRPLLAIDTTTLRALRHYSDSAFYWLFASTINRQGNKMHCHRNCRQWVLGELWPGQRQTTESRRNEWRQ